VSSLCDWLIPEVTLLIGYRDLSLDKTSLPNSVISELNPTLGLKREIHLYPTEPLRRLTFLQGEHEFCLRTLFEVLCRRLFLGPDIPMRNTYLHIIHWPDRAEGPSVHLRLPTSDSRALSVTGCSSAILINLCL